jgi:penicillin-binding protein 1B
MMREARELLPGLFLSMLRRLALGLLLLLVIATTAGSIVAWSTVRRWDVAVSEKFLTHRWTFPSKIYADSGVIYPGIDLAAVGFLDRVRDLGYQPVHGEVTRKGDYALNGDTLDVYFHDFSYPVNPVAGHSIRIRLAGTIVTRIEDRSSGQEIYTLESEPELLSGLYEGVWEERHLVTLQDVPPLLLHAIIDVEDQRFYVHHGVDIHGVARALWVNLRSGRTVQGGSTLTQQLMKNFFLTDERSLRRKLTEALMALIVERRFTKDEILENYINQIYLGQKGAQGVYGVWEASRFYFAKPPQDLTVGEMAMLAALIKGPNKYSPVRDPQRALRRRNYALSLMRQQDDITSEQYEAALAEPLRVAPALAEGKDAPYFVDFVRQELAHNYPAELLTSEGLQIYTSLDMNLQRLAEEVLPSGLAELEKQHPRLHADAPAEQLEGCLITIQPHTGAIKAMVGGRDYRSTQFNRCTQALRQPGSVFKPFTYLTAFEQTRHSPQPIRPTTRLDDAPFEWLFDNQVWTPANYKKRYLGEVSVREALELSLNAATARLAHEVGVAPIIETARRMGITSPLPPYPSVVLGSAEVTPFEVAQAFSVLANGGLRAAPLSITRVLDRGDQPIERNPVQLEQVIPADTAYLVTHLMEGVVDVGTAAGARKRGFKRPAAGKTGTTNDYRDAWFVGFTPELLTVVWIGFDHKRAINLAGGEAALPIWTEFMKRATAGLPASPFLPPPGVTMVRIDPASGDLATPHCPQSIEEAFYDGAEPTTPCPLHGTTPEPPAETGDGAAAAAAAQPDH